MNTSNSTFNLAPEEAKLVRLEDLLSAKLAIPIFQRPYDWRTKQVEDLINDLKSCADTSLFLGLIVLHREESGTYTIIDGQQRITSLLLLLGSKGKAPPVLPQLRPDDNDFFRRLMTEANYSNEATPDTLSQRLLKDAYDHFAKMANDVANAAQQTTCIAYVAPRLAGATSLFERINLRGLDVSQFDLVKNRIIGWLATLNDTLAHELRGTITNGYDKLYRMLNPKIRANSTQHMEFDSDRLLRVHWILFRKSAFGSSDHVIDAIEDERQSLANTPDKLKKYIQSYIDTLNDITRFWVTIQDPSRLPQDAAPAIRSALNEFHRLNRFAELEPLIVAVMLRFGLGSDTADFIKMCTIASFRDALAKRRGNRGRSPKWTMAKAVYQQTCTDATGAEIISTRDLAHHFFWKTATWWNIDECKELSNEDTASSDCASPSFCSGAFYQEFSHVMHYFFWEYGLILGKRSSQLIYGSQSVQVNQFLNDEYWKEFRSHWDIEHVFPVRPDQNDAQNKGHLNKLRQHEKVMHPWLNHIGNLTVVPRGENRGLLSNSDFLSKREAMLQRGEVRFNELFRDSKYIGNLVDGPFWGANNCKKRFEHLSQFADVRWGLAAVKALGVGKYDKRVKFDLTTETDEEDEGV